MEDDDGLWTTNEVAIRWGRTRERTYERLRRSGATVQAYRPEDGRIVALWSLQDVKRIELQRPLKPH